MNASRSRPAIALTTAVLTGLLVLVVVDVTHTFNRLTASLAGQKERLESLQLADALLGGVIDMQTASRGFIITNDARFIAPFEPGRLRFQAALAGALRAYANNDRQLQRLKQLQSLESHWREGYLQPLLAQRATARTEAEVKAVASIVATARGSAMVDEMRMLIGELRQQESADIERATADSEEIIAHTRQVLTRSALFILTLLGCLVFLLMRAFKELAGRNLALAAEARQRERAQDELTRANSLLAAIFSNAPYCVLSVSPDGLIQSVNRATEWMLGYRANELVGRARLLDFISAPAPGSAAAVSVASDMAALEKKADHQPGKELNVQITRRDGELIDVSLALGELRDADGSISGYVVMGQDISDRKAVSRMKDEFVSTVSHELRTPLTAIVGALALVRSGETGELPDQAAAFVDMAAKNSERLASLVDDLLDMEKLAHGRMPFSHTDVPLRSFLLEAMDLNHGYAEKHGVTLTLKEPVPSGSINVDRHRMHQVMANLLSNAAKFSPRGDTVLVEASLGERGIIISVSDNGEGIPQEFRSRIFARFAQAESREGRQPTGTGLGLSIAKAIIEQMNGSIGFVSPTPGKDRGTRFFVHLPFRME